MSSKRSSPVLMANVVFTAILVGVVAGVALRSAPGDVLDSIRSAGGREIGAAAPLPNASLLGGDRLDNDAERLRYSVTGGR